MNDRTCPDCGTAVRGGLTVCPACSSFLPALDPVATEPLITTVVRPGAPGPSPGESTTTVDHASAASTGPRTAPSLAVGPRGGPGVGRRPRSTGVSLAIVVAIVALLVVGYLMLG